MGDHGVSLDNGVTIELNSNCNFSYRATAQFAMLFNLPPARTFAGPVDDDDACARLPTWSSRQPPVRLGPIVTGS